jgi:glucose-1-phosphate cytidylyltransferase
VILCGGKGTRMGESSESIPKPLLMVGNKPVLEHIMDHFAKYGINEFILCLGHLGEKIKNYFLSNPVNYMVEMIDTELVERANAGLETTKAQRLLKVKSKIEGDFFVTYGDDLSNVNISNLINFHKKENKIVTLTAVKLHNPYGVLELDEFEPNSISNFKEKPLMREWINGGYFIFNYKIFDYINETEDLEKEVFEKLVKEKQIVAYRHPGFWKSMNTIKDSIELNDMFKKGELQRLMGTDKNE